MNRPAGLRLRGPFPEKPMVKIERRGQILEIHEDALAQHEANGWRQVASEQAEQPEADAPRRGRRPQVASEQAE